jgi:hypothetical protein
VVEVFAAVRVAHLHLVLLYDLADLIHNYRKHADTNHHANDCKHHFQVTYWIEISVTYGGQHSQREVQTSDQLKIDCLIFELEINVPCFLIIAILLHLARDKEPDTAKEESTQ